MLFFWSVQIENIFTFISVANLLYACYVQYVSQYDSVDVILQVL